MDANPQRTSLSICATAPTCFKDLFMTPLRHPLLVSPIVCSFFVIDGDLFLMLTTASVMEGYNGTIFAYGQTGAGNFHQD